jgi:hypothetical protein
MKPDSRSTSSSAMSVSNRTLVGATWYLPSGLGVGTAPLV